MPDEPKRRGRGRPKGTPASDAQKQAGKANLTKAHQAKKERKVKRAELALVEPKPRWKQLEDGDITVQDLKMEELQKKVCANNDGTWEGRRHIFDPRIQGRMEAERLRRLKRMLSEHTPDAIDAIGEIITDAEHNQRLQAAKLAIEYDLGKVPEVIHVGEESEWDRMNQTAFVILRGAENVEESGDEDDASLAVEA